MWSVELLRASLYLFSHIEPIEIFLQKKNIKRLLKSLLISFVFNQSIISLIGFGFIKKSISWI